MIQRYELGWAPDAWDAFNAVLKDSSDQRDATSIGLVAQRKEQRGVYDRFRGRIVLVYGLGGKSLLLRSTLLSDAETPKYVNSSESAIFKKSRSLTATHQNQYVPRIWHFCARASRRHNTSPAWLRKRVARWEP